MAYTGESVLHVWSLGTGNTGLTASISTSLIYYADATTRAGASESVTVAEVGSAGDYVISYTPLSAGTYKLKANESTLYGEVYFEDIVSASPSDATSGDSYCSEGNVCAWTGITNYTSGTIPTEANVLTFMQLRAGEIYSWLREVMGDSATGPDNYATSISTSTDAGLALSHTCRLANAIGAAMDALEAGSASENPRRSERVAELAMAYAGMKSSVQAMGVHYLGSAGRASTHISVGEVSRASVSSRVQQGLAITDATDW